MEFGSLKCFSLLYACVVAGIEGREGRAVSLRKIWWKTLSIKVKLIKVKEILVELENLLFGTFISIYICNTNCMWNLLLVDRHGAIPVYISRATST